MFFEALNAVARRSLFLAAVVFGIASGCLGQVRVSHASTISTIDGRYVTVTYLEGEPSGRKGSMRAPIEEINLDKAQISSPYDGTWWIVLECRNKFGTTCFTDLDTGEDLAWFSYPYVSCSSRSECESFLQALKDAITTPARQNSGRPAESPQTKSAEKASTYLPAATRPSQASKNKPADEPVIDGSKIPSQINFNKNQSTGPKPEVRDAPKPLFDQLGRQFLGSENTTDNGTEKLTSLFDSLAKQRPETFTSDNNKKSPLDFYTPEVEKYGAGLFDDARKGRMENFTDPVRSAARQWLTEQYNEMSRNNASRSLTGKPFDELPEEFRKDYSVWEAGIKRLFEPFSLRGGLKFVDAFGSLFNLWKEP